VQVDIVDLPLLDGVAPKTTFVSVNWWARAIMGRVEGKVFLVQKAATLAQLLGQLQASVV
tara:strand:+ start:941 stop:1120 length:180 start_codon:yes stop_codon:yes gene_type:complete